MFTFKFKAYKWLVFISLQPVLTYFHTVCIYLPNKYKPYVNRCQYYFCKHQIKTLIYYNNLWKNKFTKTLICVQIMLYKRKSINKKNVKIFILHVFYVQCTIIVHVLNLQQIIINATNKIFRKIKKEPQYHKQPSHRNFAIFSRTSDCIIATSLEKV